ncbi:TolC family protein [Chitinophaga nivalis]|uniref:TolC family protein n=1 Tax=Chitinophaga nivalis TaxID=2991709 RepID=A0ABT3IQA9_9BACT|nr:TolC family protein [Chitinophaga nivalis]MCW3464148.1 TolC family protein [Chitinophaga nivalis]MCW3486162.1 TolC family protein [Chitinophaga nivalis]
MKKKMTPLFLIGCLAAGLQTSAQTATSFIRIPLTYDSFLQGVGQHNLGYAAEQYNVAMATANTTAAKIFPDPQLSMGAVDNGQRRMKMGYGFTAELGWTLELGGKRRARIHLATSQEEMAQALLTDYFRQLRANATLDYLNALKQQAIYEVRYNSYQSMQGIADADSIRFKLGAITAIDARQSRLEAAAMRNEVYEGDAGRQTALLQLSTLLGKAPADTLYQPTGDFSGFERHFDLAALLTAALNNRADLLAARKSRQTAKDALQLAKANRVLDLGLTAGVGNNAVVRNVVAPTPSTTAVTAGISIPLKFSNRNPGELKAATYGVLQADVVYEQTVVQIQQEVRQASINYYAAGQQVRQFKTGLLADAQQVLEGKKYSYSRGETTLLEVLNAQRTYNETQQSYYETLYNYAAALVELERAAGIWDINF